MSESLVPLRSGALRAELLERSMNCFMAGLCGLIPVLGIPAAWWAFSEYLRLKRSPLPIWNAAHPYLVAGAICAVIGLAVSLVLIVVVAIAASAARG